MNRKTDPAYWVLANRMHAAEALMRAMLVEMAEQALRINSLEAALLEVDARKNKQ